MPLLLDPSAGLITQTLQEILSEVNARLQELGGADLDALDASTPEGLICGVLAERELLLQGGLHDALDALSVDRAQGAVRSRTASRTASRNAAAVRLGGVCVCARVRYLTARGPTATIPACPRPPSPCPLTFPSTCPTEAP